MIRQILTTLLCSVTFFLVAFVIPVKAEHPFTTNFVCLTYEHGIEATKYAEAGGLKALFKRSRIDPTFECYKVPLGYAYWAEEIVHTYMVNGVRKAMVKSFDGNGREVYTFGDMKYVRSLMHKPDERGA